MLPCLTLIIGGAASGKSAYGEQIVKMNTGAWVYLATSQVFDAEMRRKVQAHVAARGDGWRTIEEPLHPENVFQDCDPGDVLLLDCATMWLTNVMLAEADLDTAKADFLSGLARAKCPIVVVTNEVGHGIVPDNRLARDFRNQQGKLNQELAALADTVVLVTAGLPMALKGTLPL